MTDLIRNYLPWLLFALGIPVADASAGLRRLIKQHKKEWSSFAGSLGNGSFVKAWIDRS